VRRRLNRIGVVLGIFAGFLLTSTVVKATDIPIFPTGPVYRLTNLVWGTSTQPGFNNNYFFTPLNPSESVCVYVYNNNTTSAHSFVITISSNGNPANTTPSDPTWFVYPLQANPTVAAGPSPPATFGAQANAAALVSINLSASTTQAGSPETANITIVQTQGLCPSNNNPTPQGTIQFNPLNGEGVSAANAPVTVTLTGSQTNRYAVYSVSARCSAGTSGITITQAGTTIWSTGAAEVTTTTFKFQWNPGLTLGPGQTLVITLATCGAANTGTLDTQVSQVVQQ
jgi:hypothetical protein